MKAEQISDSTVLIKTDDGTEIYIREKMSEERRGEVSVSVDRGYLYLLPEGGGSVSLRVTKERITSKD